MASGFIILKDRSCFATRWTGYDKILAIIIREIKKINSSSELITILSNKIPHKNAKDEFEMGWGFIDESSREIISRELDMRGLSNEHHNLFWQALQEAHNNLLKMGEEYSILNPERSRQLLERRELSKTQNNPLNHSDWSVLADEDFEKLS